MPPAGGRALNLLRPAGPLGPLGGIAVQASIAVAAEAPGRRASTVAGVAGCSDLAGSVPVMTAYANARCRAAMFVFLPAQWYAIWAASMWDGVRLKGILVV